MFHKPLYLIILVLTIAVGAKAYNYHRNALEAATAAIILEHDVHDVEEMERQLDASNALLADNLVRNAVLNDEKRTLELRVSQLSDSLRKRPSRQDQPTQDQSPSSCPTPSNTGEGLYREDGEFLAREAADAQGVQAERNFYYDSYNKLKNELDKLNGKN